MYTLGISAFSHDSAAALMKGSEIIALIEEERFDRRKYSGAFPEQAIRHCLEIGGIEAKDISHIAFFKKPLLELAGAVEHGIKFFPGSMNLFKKAPGSGAVVDESFFLERLVSYFSAEKHLRKKFPIKKSAEFHFVEHHFAHAASAFYTTGFKESAILTWDGRGEKASTAGWLGKENQIQKVFEIRIPHSLGHFYSAITAHLGFKPFADEWKIMGMSAFGSDRYHKDFERLFFLRPDGSYRLNLRYFSFQHHGGRKMLSALFLKEFGRARESSEALTQTHFDIAASAQKSLETMGLHVARSFQKKTGLDSLCVTGGVAQNILLNQRLINESGFKEVHIQPVATDAGAALGAALHVLNTKYPTSARSEMKSLYLGPSYSNQEIQEFLNRYQIAHVVADDICSVTAHALAAGKIVGWFQGRMEAGPRALGNRSLLASPLRLEFKERLNTLVKKREFFRPFAPAVPEEEAHRFFTSLSDSNCFMAATAQVRNEAKEQIPAAIQIDGSARVQTVKKETNPLFWKLLNKFGEITGVPVLINTSLNDNEPIVCSPDHAIKTFLKTNIDHLAIGDFFCSK